MLKSFTRPLNHLFRRSRYSGPWSIVLLSLFLLVGCSAKAKFDGHLKRADSYFEKGDHERARIEYLNAFQIDRDNPHVSERLGDCFLRLDDASRAIQFYSHAETLRPANGDLGVKIAGIFLLAGKLKEAREKTEELLKVNPQNSEALVLLANASTTSNEVVQTYQRIQTLISNTPPAAPLFVAKGILSQRLGKQADAEAAFKRAVELDPKASRNHLILGNFYAQNRNTNAAAVSLKLAFDNAPVQSAERIQYIEFLKDNGRIEESRKLLLDSVREQPGFVAAWNSLGELELDQNNLDLASEYTAKSLAEKPGNRDGLINQARLSILKRDFDAAATGLQDVVQRYPRDARAHYQLAVVSLVKGDQSAAASALDKAVEINPNFLQAILLRARLLIVRGDLNGAVSSLSRATQLYPNAPQPYYLLAAAYSARGTIDDAVDVYQSLIKKFPGDPTPHQLLGSTLRRANRVPQARQAYENALKINPNLITVVDEIVELDLDAKDFSAAAARITANLEKYPTNGTFRLMEAKLHFAQRNFSDAETSIRKAIELDPANSTAFLFLANLFKSTGKLDAAISEYEGLLRKNDKDATSLLNLAVLQEAKGEFSKARQHYEALLRLAPKNVMALNNLAYLLGQHSAELDLALGYARQASELVPNDPSTADTYGWLLWKKGEFSKAATLLAQAAEGLPQNPEVQFHLGMAHYMNGASAPARTSLSAAVASTNQFAGKEMARSALDILQIDPAKASPESVSKLDRFIADNPRDVYAQAKLAQVFEAKQEWAKARDRYESALKLAPNSGLLLGRLAALHAGPLKEQAKGLEIAKRAWAAGSSPELAAILGPLGYQAGDFRWAYNLLLEAQRGNPDDPEVLFYSGVVAYSQNRLQQAIDALASAGRSRSLSTNLATLAKAGSTLASFHAGHQAVTVDQAQKAIDVARAVDPNFPPALVVAGLLAERRNDFTAARNHYESALKLFPNLIIAQRQLVILLAEKLPDDARAQQFGASLRAEFPDDTDLAKALGKIAYRKGEHREAARLLGAALVAHPNDADLLYHLGMSQAHLKEAAAKANLQRAVSLEPNSPLAAEAKKAIASAK